MFIYILLAIINGICIGISRSINGRLSINVGAFKASFWNHLVGFIFLTLLLVILGNFKVDHIAGAPLYSYLGGFLGVLFVAINSYVLPKIGGIMTILLVISGQMITGVLVEYKSGAALSTLLQFLGIAIIMLGVYVAKLSSLRREKN